MLLHLSEPQFLHLVNKNNNKTPSEGYSVDYNKSAHKLLLSCFEPLSLLKHIVWTSRTISLFRYSHDIITNPSKSRRTRPLKSFKGYSLSFDKPKGFGLLSLDRILAPLSCSCLHQCLAPQVHVSLRGASEGLYGNGSWGDLSLLAPELHGPLPNMMTHQGCTEPPDRVDTQ